MTVEKQLLDALQRFGEDRHLKIDGGPMANVSIPLLDGAAYLMPMILLASAPDVDDGMDGGA